MAQAVAKKAEQPEPTAVKVDLRPLKDMNLVWMRADQEDQYWKVKLPPGMTIAHLHNQPTLWGTAGKRLKPCDRVMFDSPDGWVTDYIMVIDVDGEKPTLDVKPGGGIRVIEIPGRLPKWQDSNALIRYGADFGGLSGFAAYRKSDGTRLTGFWKYIDDAKLEYSKRDGQKV
jgi:hypothetical protein